MYVRVDLVNSLLFLQKPCQPLITNTRISVSVSPDPESLLVEERQKVLDFFTKGCGCAIFKDRPCSGMFNYEYIYDFRSQCAELTRAELDMMLLGQLSALTDTSEQSANSLVHRHSPASRQRSYTHFLHRGKRICRNTFLFLHNISAKKLKNIKGSFLQCGVAPRSHGNAKRLPANTLAYEDTQYVIQFLTTYAEAHAILLTGRIPGYKRSDIQLLPSSTTKRGVWLMYCTSLNRTSTSDPPSSSCLQPTPNPQSTSDSPSISNAQSGSDPTSFRSNTPIRTHMVAYSTFCRIWQQILPHIRVTKPMSDLCWICQSNSIAIMRSANHPEEEKSEVKVVYLYTCTCTYMRMYTHNVQVRI